MAYSPGGLIEATDYNGFVSTTSGANVNNVWSTGSTDSGWGQSALATVSTAGSITATQWASLVNTISSMASQTGTAITSRTAPVAGNTINILDALNTDLTNITTNRQNAVANGTQYTAWTGINSNTFGSSGTEWVFGTDTLVDFESADAARYFFNAGGRIKIQVSKTSTGETGDPEWNDLANTLCGDIYITGGTATQTIAGSNYTGTTKVGGTGTPSILQTGIGWHDLTPGAAATIVYKQFADTAPYTNNYIQHTLSRSADSTRLTIATRWVASDGDPISGGTASSGATPGTAATTIVTYFPPSTTYLTNSWGTPTVEAIPSSVI
jgi:hypothetical protein